MKDKRCGPIFSKSPTQAKSDPGRAYPKLGLIYDIKDVSQILISIFQSDSQFIQKGDHLTLKHNL